MSKLTIVAKMQVEENKLDVIRAAQRKLIAETLKEKGCINYDLHQDNNDPTLFLFYENWESRALWQQHINSPHVAEYRATTKGMVKLIELNEMTLVE